MYRLYSDELTDKEKKLGFVKAFVPNPQHQYYGHPSIMPAVILPLGKSNRLIKTNCPPPLSGLNYPTPPSGCSYSHEVFGTYPHGRPEDAGWIPVGVGGMPDVELAIAAARKGLFEVKFTLAPAVIELRCPKCQHGFNEQADHLPFDGKTTCPKCKHSEGTGEFAAYNT